MQYLGEVMKMMLAGRSGMLRCHLISLGTLGRVLLHLLERSIPGSENESAKAHLAASFWTFLLKIRYEMLRID